jgi:lipopolysaccharide export system protein LptA
MPLSVSRLRRWFAAAAIVMIAIVAGMYGYARWRVRNAVHEIPKTLGLNIQQTAEGFSISKSYNDRTMCTISASKVVQFKQGGRAELHDVKITIFGKDSRRFDRVTGDDFEYDPSTGEVSAKGQVLIDLESNPEGPQHPDQAAPSVEKNPIHLETNGLVFNANTGNASASGKVAFHTAQGSGSAMGVDYIALTHTLTLKSNVQIDMLQPHNAQLRAVRGVISKEPRSIILTDARLTSQKQSAQAETTTLFLRDDNTVERVVSEGNVESNLHGHSNVHARMNRAEMFLEGKQDLLRQAVLSGNVRFETTGDQPAESSAGKMTLNFGGKQILTTVHAEDGVRLLQAKAAAPNPANTHSGDHDSAAQNVEMTAPAMDFVVKNGRLLERAETGGPPQITISQPGTSQKTVVTAAKFVALFTGLNRLESLHGEPDAKIVNSVPGQPDRVSTSHSLQVAFQPAGGVSSIVQQGDFVYVDGSRKATADRATYNVNDQTLALNGSPRIADSGMNTVANAMRLNRVTGDAFADGNVKSTYSDLKVQPNGGMLASSDPIHVTSRNMSAHRSSATVTYSGDARLWQNANVVEAPTIEFDRNSRSLVAQGANAHPVSTVLVQADKSGKETPITLTSARLTYRDSDRKVYLEGGVVAKGADATMTARQMTVFLLPRSQSQKASDVGVPGQLDRIEADGSVIFSQPSRRASGDRLVYTAAEEKFVLTGGPPSIFDAERGQITGDSLTFFRRDDRVLVEGTDRAPTVTKARVAR